MVVSESFTSLFSFRISADAIVHHASLRDAEHDSGGGENLRVRPSLRAEVRGQLRICDNCFSSFRLSIYMDVQAGNDKKTIYRRHL